MAATTTIAVSITLAFVDATTRTIKFNNVDADEVPNVKARVKAINTDYPEAMAKTFISAIGAQSTMISKAMITQTKEEVIYSYVN